jgi:hypothetical protein
MWLAEYTIDVQVREGNVGAKLEEDVRKDFLLLNEALLDQVQDALIAELPNFAEMGPNDACSLSAEHGENGNGTKSSKATYMRSRTAHVAS